MEFKNRFLSLIKSKNNDKPTYWLTRFIFLRALGFVYFFAFLSLAIQVIPLIGENGLLPASNFLEGIHSFFGSASNALIKLPTIFWLNSSDTFLSVFAWAGVILSVIVMIGYANSIMMFVLWLIYMSYVNIGQVFYGYGWEIQLLETGFLAIFFCPLIDWRPFPKKAPPVAIVWLLRWLAFRIYLGAGLIKIRGDECWRNLTCMKYHYETQPIPNPLSRIAHFFPSWVHKFEVLWNHFIELFVPFFIFVPRIARYAAGVLLISFQFLLILSGNLSFLNYLTILPAIACFDDKFLRKILPKKIVEKASHAHKNQIESKFSAVAAWSYFVIVLILSVPIIQNLLSSNQVMNTSFTTIPLVNTYGAFGSVGRERYELVIEGTSDEKITKDTQWKAYEFKAKPTDVNRPLPIIAPYQPRIDWQIWFAAMEPPQQNPWLLHMIWKLLDNDKATLSLLAKNPFLNEKPKYIRVQYYKYKFAKPFAKPYWEREYIGEWLSPLSKETKGFKEYIEANGWKD